MAVWQEIAAFATSKIISTEKLDIIIGNLNFLRTPARYFYERLVADADYTTTSTTFVDIDATNMVTTFTTYGNPVRISLRARVISSTTGWCEIEFVVDGAALSNDFAIGVHRQRADIDQGLNVERLVELAAGSHTFRAQWSTTAGTLTMDRDSVIQFEVVET